MRGMIDKCDRRRFMCAAGSAIAGLGVGNGAPSNLGPEPEAIWNHNPGKPGSHVYPGNKQADIWVFSGQSNSQGLGMLKSPVEPDPRILFFRADNRWVLAQEPLNPLFAQWDPYPVEKNILLQRTGVDFPSGESPENFVKQMKNSKVAMGGVGPGLAFAKHLVQFIDRPLGLLYCGVGGSPIKSWNPTVSASNYEAMIHRIAMVGTINGLIWYQGETDAETPSAADVFEEATLKLFDSVRKDTGISDLPILCVQLGRFVWNYDSHARDFEKIRDIQRRLPALRSNVYTISALDLPLEDPAHISFEGHQRLGRRLAEVALSHVYRQVGHSPGISMKNIEVLQADNQRPMIRVTFDGVSGKLSSPGLPTGFELRTPLPAREPVGPSAHVPMHIIYRVDFDPTDRTAVILGVCDNTLLLSGGAKFHPLREPFTIIYGPGMSPYVNIVDEKDMSIPAFGPVEVTP